MNTQYTPIASAYVAIKDDDPADRVAIFPTFYEACGDVRGKSVLELCCGEGRAGRGLLVRGARHVVGVDENPSMLALARERQVANTDYRQLTVGKMGQIGLFDLIVGPWTLHYSMSELELFAMFRDVAVNLKPGGLFVGLNEDPQRPFGGTERIGSTSHPAGDPLVDGCPVTVTIYGNGESAAFRTYHWFLGTYRAAARAAGLELSIIPFRITAEGRTEMGDDWCREFEANICSCVFVCRHIQT